MLLEPVATRPADDAAAAALGYSDAEIAAMTRAVMTLFERWRLSDQEAATLLGGITTKSVQRWRQGKPARIGRDQADRMSNLLGIHKALRLLLRSQTRGYEWIRQPNDAFGGRPALDIMLGGGLTDLMRVRHYLDAVRGAW